MNESPGVPTLTVTCFVLGVAGCSIVKVVTTTPIPKISNDNIVQKVEKKHITFLFIVVGLNCVKPLHMTCYQQLKASALMARNLVLIFFVVICPKTLKLTK